MITLEQCLEACRTGAQTLEAERDRFERTEQAHRALRAFISVAPELLRQHAERAKRARSLSPQPLFGALIAVKDNIDVAGYVTSAGTPLLEDCRAVADAGVVDRLVRAGAIIAGKTNMHELAYGISSQNARFGFVGNPVDAAHSAGGSSGGSAAAVAAGMVAAALGTDTGGSVRIPAAFCGCVGFRPSQLRYPADGIVALARSRDTAGLLTATAGCAEILDGVITGHRAARDVDIRTLRFGVPADFRIEDLDPSIERQFNAARRCLVDAGAAVIEIEVPGVFERVGDLLGAITAFEIRRDVLASLRERRPELSVQELRTGCASPDVRAAFDALFAPDAPHDEQAYLHAKHEGMPALRALIDGELAHYSLDALIFPTTPVPAFAIDAGSTLHYGGRERPLFRTTVRNMQTAPLAGLPSISIPMPRDGGELPGGLTIEGAFGNDKRILAVARAIERVFSRSGSAS